MSLARSFRSLTLAAATVALSLGLSIEPGWSAEARIGLEKAASEQPISGPVLGYVFDASAASLRPLLGIPGASHVGGALALPFRLSVAAVSPNQSFALGSTVGDGALVVLDLRGSAPEGRIVSGAMGGADRIVFSPEGVFAAAYDRQSQSVQLLTGFGERVEVTATLRLASLPGVLTALAVSDDGAAVLAATSGRGGGQVFALDNDGASKPVATVGRAMDVAFFPGSSDALIADFDRNEIVKLSDVGGSASSTVLASSADGLQAPMAVAATADGRAIAAAEGAAALIPAAGGAIRFVECDCRPQTLTRLAGGSFFRLTDDLNQPILLLDAGRLATDGAVAEPRVMFVPALAERASADRPEAAPVARTR